MRIRSLLIASGEKLNAENLRATLGNRPARHPAVY
jgi:hypothetical protein